MTAKKKSAPELKKSAKEKAMPLPMEKPLKPGKDQKIVKPGKGKKPVNTGKGKKPIVIEKTKNPVKPAVGKKKKTVKAR